VDLQRHDEVRVRAFYHDLLDRVRGLPGVRSASETVDMLINVTSYSTSIHRVMSCNMVGPGYFDTMDVPILVGGASDEHDARCQAI
jgi:hypothetical protein